MIFPKNGTKKEPQVVKEIEEDQANETKITSFYDAEEFQSNYIDHICELTGIESISIREVMTQTVNNRFEDFLTHKDKTHFKSKFYQPYD